MNTLPYIDIHTHRRQTQGIVSLFNNGPVLRDDLNELISVGIHPRDIEKHDIPGTLESLKFSAAHQSVKAIGECGMDRLTATPMDLQEEIFIEHIKIASRLKKPVIVHCVKAFDELIRIKSLQNAVIPFLVHGFNNKWQIAERLLKNGFYLSFGKGLLINDSNAQKAIVQTGISDFLLETDDSDLSINIIFNKAAELKQIGVDELKEQMMLNYKRIFNG
ncbi:MAG TPA: TatD family hydrolase [Bacteroidia bacterium]